MPNKIVYLKRKLPQGFIGMNAMANRRLKVVKNHPEKTFYIYDDGNKDRMQRVLVHEEVEEHLMRKKGLSYPRAHKISNLIEDDTDIRVITTRGDSSKRGSTRIVRRRI